MNKKGDALASKMGFFFVFLFLFVFAILYSVKFIEQGEINKRELLVIEDSVIINRVISCASGDSFGEIVAAKFNDLVLPKCLENENYAFAIEVDNEGIDTLDPVSWGDLGFKYRTVDRPVLLRGKKAVLKVDYRKNVPV